MSADQVPNQGGLSHQNGNGLPPIQMHNLVGGVAMAAAAAGGDIAIGGVTQQHNMINLMDRELLIVRGFMCDKIFAILMRRMHKIDEAQRTKWKDFSRTKFKDISRRLEEGLFKAALTKEEYMNMDTLEQRLSRLIWGRPGNSQNQRHQQLVNSSSSIGTTTPTPGMSQNGNSSLMVTSSVDSSMIAASGGNTIAPTTVNTGSLLSTGGIQSNSFNRSDGLPNGYQQPSIGVQRTASQMNPPQH